jgi:Flp pilus assembly protein TadD
VQTGPQVAADRYSYLATLGWSVLAGGLAVAGATRLTPRLAAAAAILLVLAVRTATQIGVWHDGLTLWAHTATVDPGNAFAQLRLAEYDRRAGRLDAAIARVRESLRLSPYFGEAHYELGALLTAHGDYDEARSHYDVALGLAPPNAERLSNLGILLAWSGRPAEAIPRYRAALALRPDLPGLHENLAYALAATGDVEHAMAELEEAIQLDPTAPAPRQALATLRARGTP